MNRFDLHKLCILLIVMCTSSLSFAQIDLELSISTDNPDIPRWGRGMFTLTLENKSDNDATGVTVMMDLPSNQVAIVGGSAPITSSGEYRKPTWTNINVPANGTATLTLNLFNKVPDLELFAEVTAADQLDIDSTPNNGLISEDDTAIFPMQNGGGSDSEEGELGIDLELSLSTDPIEIAQWSAGMFTLTLENKGQLDATDVSVRIPLNRSEVVLVGSIRPMASSGVFSQSTWDNISIPAGGTATLSLQLYNKVANLELFVEVSAAAQTDIDSTPDNGIAGEDDEAYYPAREMEEEEEEEEEEDPENAIDLELIMTTDSPDIEQWSAGKFTVILENKGENDATGVSVSLPLNISEVTIAGNGRPTASVGSFNRSTWSGIDLAAGSVATLELELYSKVPELKLFGEVIAADQPDIDSAPANGECCTPNEDDEATLLSDLTLSNIEFPSELERGEPIRFGLDVDNIGYATAAGDFIVAFYLSEDEELGDGDRSISIIRTGDLTVDKHNATALINLPLDVLPGEYHLIIVADIDGEVQELNEENNLFSNPVTVGAPGDIDLELRFNSSSENVNAFVNLPLTLTITNTSDSDATGVVVNFPLEAGKVVLAGGTIPTFSQGNYNYFNGMWYVRDLHAGESATLEVQFFPISADYIPFAQVIEADQIDEDSTPNNGTCCVATEDDEAAFPDGAIIGDKVDIEVSLSTEETEVGKFSNLPISVQISNKGSVAATDVVVSLEACGLSNSRLFGGQAGIVYANAASVADVGDYNKIQQLWRIDELAAGQSATLDLQLYSLTDEQVRVRAIAIRYEGDDLDSSAEQFDFEACNATEDDEAVLDINTGESVNDGAIFGTTTSIHNTLHLYPNPATERLQIRFQSEMEQVQYMIYDVQGKAQQSGTWDSTGAYNEAVLNVEELPVGIYFLQILEGDTQQTIRFSKL